MNGVLPPLFSKEERTALDAVVETASPSRGEAALFAGKSRSTRERVQAESLARLSRELPVKPVFLPLLFEDAARPDAIRDLAKRM